MCQITINKTEQSVKDTQLIDLLESGSTKPRKVDLSKTANHLTRKLETREVKDSEMACKVAQRQPEVTNISNTSESDDGFFNVLRVIFDLQPMDKGSDQTKQDAALQFPKGDKKANADRDRVTVAFNLVSLTHYSDLRYLFMPRKLASMSDSLIKCLGSKELNQVMLTIEVEDDPDQVQMKKQSFKVLKELLKLGKPENADTSPQYDGTMTSNMLSNMLMTKKLKDSQIQTEAVGESGLFNLAMKYLFQKNSAAIGLVELSDEQVSKLSAKFSKFLFDMLEYILTNGTVVEKKRDEQIRH